MEKIDDAETIYSSSMNLEQKSLRRKTRFWHLLLHHNLLGSGDLYPPYTLFWSEEAPSHRAELNCMKTYARKNFLKATSSSPNSNHDERIQSLEPDIDDLLQMRRRAHTEEPWQFHNCEAIQYLILCQWLMFTRDIWDPSHFSSHSLRRNENSDRMNARITVKYNYPRMQNAKFFELRSFFLVEVPLWALVVSVNRAHFSDNAILSSSVGGEKETED